MLICEVVSLATLIALVVHSSYTDVKSSTVSNRTLAYATVSGMVTNLVYSFVTLGAYFVEYLSNIVLLSVLSVLLYAFHLWAAGDSKLVIAVAFCLPGRFLTFWDIGLFPSFSIVAIAFIVAFIVIFTESVALGIRNRDLFQSLPLISFSRYAYSYLFTISAVTVFFAILKCIVPRIFEEHGFMLMAVDFIVMLALMQLRNRFQLHRLKVAAAMMCGVLFLLLVSGNVALSLTFDFMTWALALFIMVACVLAGKYGYQTVRTSSIQAGMILSSATVLSFRSSRVKGLPNGLAEDLTCRLSDDEAASVRRWENSVHGSPYVTIVRKLPFALFIGIGTIAFIAIEVIMIWR